MSPAHRDPTLGDLGEFRVIREVIEPALANSGAAGERGDDAGLAQTAGGERIVVTCDVAVRPAVWDLVQDPWESWGWYAVAGSLSDLAAAGASPLAIVTSIEAPAELAASDLARFCAGMGAACRELGVPHVGGNLREAGIFACHSTVIGDLEGMPMIGRSGCRPGDVLAVVGPCGAFAAAYFDARRAGFESL
ncbi:MAG: AIR synthase related protein, partial [Actinomycetota bacterium]|nr:AIR synthase related protein [Actinomycetota bacterium]